MTAYSCRREWLLISRDSERQSESESAGKSEIESWILCCSLWNGACRYAELAQRCKILGLAAEILEVSLHTSPTESSRKNV